MHAVEFLHKLLVIDHSGVHKTRLASLTHAVTGLLSSEVLQLTAIGRFSTVEGFDKHSIKRVDRLLGNHFLVQERVDFYRRQAHRIIGQKKHPIILMDYSDVNAKRTRFILRASIALEGRSLVVYEEVHDRENYAPYWHSFLETLARLLPKDCQPVIVADAGFRGPWRKAIAHMGWYYVIRQRNRDFVRPKGNGAWFSCKKLYQRASITARYLGEFQINRSNSDYAHACIIHHPPKSRKRKTATGVIARSRHSNKNAEREREPWLLMTNLKKSRSIAKNVIRIYSARMQIEGSFRDLKSHRYGYSFKGNRCVDVNRLQILLLIAALACFVTWLMGLHAEWNKLHNKMQSNTIKSRRVLSVCTVGMTLFRKQYKIAYDDWLAAIRRLQETVMICY